MEGRISARVDDGYPGGPTGIDTSVPNIARMYDYWLDGRENFQVDRVAADRIVKLVPEAKYVAQDNRAFLLRTVRFLAEQGITQFLDIGTGLPTSTSVLDTARQVSPDCRVAYVDYDPVVVSHGQALLAKSGQATVVQADLRQPEALLSHPSVRAHLDFARPVAVLLVAILHFISDDDDPPAIVAAVRDALAPGSYVVIGHVTHDNAPDSVVAAAMATFAKSSASIWPRTANQVHRLFGGFDLVEPGVVPAHLWRPSPAGPPDRDRALALGGVARKP